MTNIRLNKKLARLESKNDQLMKEIEYLDKLLRSVGFPGGVHSAKEVAQEMLSQQEEVKEGEEG